VEEVEVDSPATSTFAVEVEGEEAEEALYLDEDAATTEAMVSYDTLKHQEEEKGKERTQNHVTAAAVNVRDDESGVRELGGDVMSLLGLDSRLFGHW